jgi:hypothetical protein
MGLRGPLPSSGSTFRGHAVVLRARTPAFLAAPGARERAIADRRGYVSIHRLVASEALGRWVTRTEVVRAIDGDLWNWDPRNLAVRPLAASLPLARRGQPKVSPRAKPGSKSRPKVARGPR